MTHAGPPDLSINLDTAYSATLHTNHGDIAIAFRPTEAPIAVNNFLFLAGDGFYDGVTFHRVVPGFVVQGGDPTGTGSGGPGYRFRDELDGDGVYRRGTVAMANAGSNTNGSQFFLCLDDVRLPHAYTIFGDVTSGMEAVDAIVAVPRNGEKPVDDCVIDSITITEG